MKKSTSSLKAAILATGITILFLFLLQYVILEINNTAEAKSSTSAYLSEVETILSKNSLQEESLIESLKEEYTIRAKAVAYYLDHISEEMEDTEKFQKLCTLLSIDEIHLFDKTGTIYASSVPNYVGYSFDSGEQIAYFKPMLSDYNLTMCQDLSPNTADGKPMIYAITWNEFHTMMVQVGIEPVRLLEELTANEIPNVVNHIPLTDEMALIIATDDGEVILGSTKPEFVDKSIPQVSSIDPDSLSKDSALFIKKCHLADHMDPHYCSAKQWENYSLYVFLSHRAFYARTIESLSFVALYLFLAYCIIMIILRRLIFTREENLQHTQMLESMSEIYYSLHLVDLKENTLIVYSAKNQVKDSYNKSEDNRADRVMVKIMHATMSQEYLERGLEFTDLTTLPERMKGKKIISMELLGKNVGWIRMSFITITQKEGMPERIVVATQIIDEEKKLAQSLYEKSYLDELTKCYNRRAYNNDLITCPENFMNNPFVYISLDLNGLKTVNDQLGHEAGDELIKGSVECMNQVFGAYGKIYRMGGDEFTALLFVDGDVMEVLAKEFNQTMASWKGKLVKSLSISFGYVLSSEAQGKTIEEISCLADARMYKAKTCYYRENGLQRRCT